MGFDTFHSSEPDIIKSDTEYNEYIRKESREEIEHLELEIEITNYIKTEFVDFLNSHPSKEEMINKFFLMSKTEVEEKLKNELMKNNILVLRQILLQSMVLHGLPDNILKKLSEDEKETIKKWKSANNTPKEPLEIINKYSNYYIQINNINSNATGINKKFEKYSLKDRTYKNLLPQNVYINEILSKENLPPIKLVALENGGTMNGTIIKDYIYIYPNNIKKYANEFGIQVSPKIIEQTISNEAMHDFLKKIGFQTQSKRIHDSNSFNDIQLTYKNIQELNNMDIHEFLSDYSSISKAPELELQRIFNMINQQSNLNNDNASKYNLNKNQEYNLKHYRFTINLIGEFFEAISGKKLSDYGYKSSIQVSKNMYQDLQSKKIMVGGKEITGVDAMILKIQEKGNEIMKKIYEWKYPNEVKKD